MSTRIILEKDVEIPLRDGTVTRANVYRPEADAPVPAILVRTPYSKDLLFAQTFSLDPVRAAESGFAVVFQDTRGRYESDGDFHPYRYEAEDGYDSVEWVAGQNWCDGSVGMSGLSYLGAAQWLAAIERPPHLKTIVPITIGSQHYMDMMSYKGGAFKVGYLLFWMTAFVAPDVAMRRVREGKADEGEVMRIFESIDQVDELSRHLPLSTLPLLKENPVADFYFEWMRRESEDSQPAAIRDHYSQIEVPALNVGGWYDYFLDGTLENFTRMQREGATEGARGQQRLLIGPWDHILGSVSSEYDFGVFASTLATDFVGLQLQHFAHHLKGERNGVDEAPPVRLFVMGENVWRDENEWPLARTEYVRWFLHSDGAAKGEGGTLSPDEPGEEAGDAYLYDPRDPAPTVGGAVGLPGLVQGVNVGPRDQRPVEKRPDVLIYTSAVLEEPLEVTGPLTATLYAASSARDTDFIVRLCDVYPDGASRILAEGVIRARYRDGYDQPSLIQPDEVYAYEIDLVATSNVFQPGHRIRVDVTSSSFPYLDRNPNTGSSLGEDGPEDLQPAVQTVFHDAARPSHLVLPVVPR